MKEHLTQAFQWAGERADVPAMAAAALGMAGPLPAAAALGHPAPGFAVALGAFLAAGCGTEPSAGKQACALLQMLAVIAAAATAAATINGHGVWTDAALAGLAGCAAAVGGYSYPLAVATGRFIPFLVIALSLAESGGNPVAQLLFLSLGGLWATVAFFVLSSAFRAAGWRAAVAGRTRPRAAEARKLHRWITSLKTLSGWQFALRLVPALAAAGVIRTLWPNHHLLWIALTVALLCQRQMEPVPARTVQRAIGAGIGVAATSLLLGRSLPGWGMALVVAALAGIGPWLRVQNYLAYTASMTPLIILILSAGGPIESGALVDRLIATLIAAALVVAANLSVSALPAARAADMS